LSSLIGRSRGKIQPIRRGAQGWGARRHRFCLYWETPATRIIDPFGRFDLPRRNSHRTKECRRMPHRTKRQPVPTTLVWMLLACLPSLPVLAGPTFPNQPGGQPGETPGTQAGQSAGSQMGPPAPPRDTPAAQGVTLSRAEIEADIQALEAQRRELLAKYAEAHPDVRAVDRRLQARKKQLEMLGPGAAAPK
jgi:hypothetical protein